ncbi:LysE family translocator [Leeia sp.]|uniref:LysE family translocator n=1 Tax=Leeia sp. TaxID=2884678 RepID=UPI0035B16B44
MTLQTWILFAFATLGLSLTPGPNGMLALSHGALYGVRRTLLTISGGVLGFVLLLGLAMSGISAILKTSSAALAWLTWLGAAWLLWLGVQLWRSPPLSLENMSADPRAHGSLFLQGLLSALSNPKVLLFFGAFLTPFIAPSAPLLPQFVVMALTFAVIEFGIELLLAVLAQRIRPWLQRLGHRFNQICAVLFGLIAVVLVLAH